MFAFGKWCRLQQWCRLRLMMCGFATFGKHRIIAAYKPQHHICIANSSYRHRRCFIFTSDYSILTYIDWIFIYRRSAFFYDVCLRQMMPASPETSGFAPFGKHRIIFPILLFKFPIIQKCRNQNNEARACIMHQCARSGCQHTFDGQDNRHDID